MSILERIFKFGVSEGFAKGLNFLLPIVLPLIVDLESFGIISILIALEFLLSEVIIFQQHEVYIRFYSTSSNKRVRLYQSSSTIILLVGLFATIIIVVLSFFPSITNFDFPLWYVYLILAGSIIQSNFTLYLSHLRAKEKVIEYSVYRVIFQSVKFVVTIIFAVILGNALSYIIGFIVANIIVSFIVLGKNIHTIKLVIEKFQYKMLVNSELFKQNIHIGIPLGISTIMKSLYVVIDRFLLQFFLSVENVGIYNFAYTQGSASFFLVTIVTLALLPQIYESGEYDSQTRKRLLQFLGLGLISVFFATIFIYFVLFPFLLSSVSSQYEQGRIIVLFASGRIAAQILHLFCGYSLIALKKVNITVVAVCVSLLIKVLLNILLIPSQGINGAGMAALVSELIGAVIMGVGLFLIRKQNIPST